ncbi:Alcohol dehydrogenase zinc-binding domain protein [metagenome]|uniref:Alcohol dehydrogenase zinc-binding domain protein n=1 Tax=metagenome TaxID=256318 RepID=A0A2P2BZK0_9ZZZZ
MKAIVQDQYGEADVLRLDEIDIPQIGPKEVLVRVHAAGVDRGAWHLMAGKPYAVRLAVGVRAPRQRVRGLDLAGTVEAVGAEVTRFEVGDEVYGIGKGSFAELAAAREDKLARKPANLGFEQAAVVPVSGLTALQAVHDVGQVKAGQRVLVVGASGGVGSFAVQLAKAAGAEVTGVCSTSKVDLVRALGADHVVDYQSADFADAAEPYDLVLDIGGSTPLARLRQVLTPTGTLVIVGGEGGGNLTGMGRQLHAVAVSPFSKQRLAMMVAKEHYSGLERLTTYLEAGQVVPSLERCYPLRETAEAVRRLVAGDVRGKVALTVPG